MKTLLASIVIAISCLAVTHASPGEWTDPPGDAALPNADIISGSVTVFEGMADFRLRFAAPPYPTTATQNIAWCLDTDHNAADGLWCGTTYGTEAALSLEGGLGALDTCNFFVVTGHGTADSIIVHDLASSLWYDPDTYTIRIVIPLSALSDDPSFNYFVAQAVGGGGGEYVPWPADFSTSTGHFTSDVGPLPPFAGHLLCKQQTVAIDIQPRKDPNVVNPKRHGRIEVAVLATDTFDISTLFPSTARFGATGTEAVPLDWRLEDADDDGDVDVVLTFEIAQTGIRCGDATATLKAEALNRAGVAGTAPIRTLGCRPGA